MSMLMRAPRECGSWFWDLEEIAAPGLESALATAAQMTEVLERHELLIPSRIKYGWYVLDEGFTGVTTSMTLTAPLADPNLPQRLLGNRPSALPEAEISDVHVVGQGIWINEKGERRKEPRLLDLSVSPAPVGLSAELSVHHDIWSWFDFSGHPHPEIYRNNAPRLATVLNELTSVLGVPPEVGDPTYFGVATRDGITTPDAYDDGSGPDLTARL